MNKKILIITDNLPEQINGVVTTYKNIESYAVADGYDFHYIHPGRFRYINCPVYNEVKLAFAWNMGQKIREISPDYIHIATEGPLGLFARGYLAIRGHRYNTAYHTKFPEGIKELIGIPESITWPLIRWFHNKSNVVLTTTPSMVAQLQSHGFGNNVVPWTRGVDRSLFKPSSNKLPYPGPILVCVSRVSAEKNLEDFFRLEYPGTKIMVGDGPKLAEYRAKYPDVIFVGAKRGAELASYYQGADCFVFPSRWDTFGLVMIEAMATGTPVAAYPVQGPIDVVEQGVTGYMDQSLSTAVGHCLKMDRDTVLAGSARWSWQAAWDIFRDSLLQK